MLQDALIDFTPTATELWSDKAFIHKRMQEQVDYLQQLPHRDLTKERRKELKQYAQLIGRRLFKRFLVLDKMGSSLLHSNYWATFTVA